MRMKRNLLSTFFVLLMVSCQMQGQTPAQMESSSAVIMPGAAFPADETPADPGFLHVMVPEVPDTLTFAGERIPMENFDVREALEKELVTIIYNHSRTVQILMNTDRYFSILEPILKENSIPRDFLFLSVAECSLDPNALSTAGAAGFWQFMAAVGRQYGLKVDGNIDQRYDIRLATKAASRLLKDYRSSFGSWTLAAAAYNVGIGGLRQRITQQGVNDYFESYLPTETMRYLYRILAYKLIIEHPEHYGYEKVAAIQHPRLDGFKTLTVSDATIDWPALAKENGISYKVLRDWNPWIRSYKYANAQRAAFEVLIPSEGFRSSARNQK